MEREALKLECLRIASQHSTNKTEVLARAKEFVEFVTGETPMTENTKPVSASMTAGKDGGRPGKG